VRIVGPENLLQRDGLSGVSAYTDLDEGIAGADVVMMLRIQRERMAVAVADTLGNFHGGYGLTRERLKAAAPDAIVMHPGPMNRGVEIDGELADDPARSAILEQVELGVAIRMACLDILTRSR
jgi:aspartate carbamoyltransferase catalytic subunit